MVRTAARRRAIGAAAALAACSLLPTAGLAADEDGVARRGTALRGSVLGPGGTGVDGSMRVERRAVRDGRTTWRRIGTVSVSDGRVATRLARGAYRLRFADGAGRLLPEYYLDALAARGATIVRVGASAVSLRTVRLATKPALRGTVTAPGGGPAARAVVEATSLDLAHQARARTSSDGSFRLGGLVPASYLLHVTSADGDSDTWWRGAATRQDADPIAVGRRDVVLDRALALPPPRELGGRVTAPSGVGLAGVYVTLTRPDGSPLVQTTTAWDGWWQLTRLPAGPVVVRYRTYQGDYAAEFHDDVVSRANATPVDVGAPGAPTRIFATLRRLPTADPPGVDLVGTVTDRDSGKVVRGVQVSAYAASGNLGSAPADVTYTRWDGSYVLEDLAPGSYVVAGTGGATSSGQPYQLGFYDGSGSFDDATRVKVASGSVARGVDLALRAYARISGTLNGPSWVDFSDVSAEITAYGDGGAVQRATTDTSGGYALDRLPGDTWRLSFEGFAGTHDGQGLCFVKEFWRDQTSLASATGVPVAWGEAVDDVSPTLATGSC